MSQTDFRSATGQLTAVASNVPLAVAGFGSVGIELAGTFSGTVEFEARVGGTWVPLAVASPDSPSTLVTTATAPGTWTADIGGMKDVRVKPTAWISGTAKVDVLAAGVGGSAGGNGGGGGGGGGTPAGPSGAVQYNNAGSFGGSASLTFGATGIVTPLGLASGGIGQVNAPYDLVSRTISDIVDVRNVFTDFSTYYVIGSTLFVTGNPAIDAVAEFYGLNIEARTALGNSKNFPRVEGMDSAAYHLGTGTVLNLIGQTSSSTNGNASVGGGGPVTLQVGGRHKSTSYANATTATSRGSENQISNDGPGTITVGHATWSQINNTSTGELTTGAGSFVASPTNSGGGLVVNLYGNYIADQTLAGTTLNYQFYSAGVLKSYHGGNFGFGALTPGANPPVGFSAAGRLIQVAGAGSDDAAIQLHDSDSLQGLDIWQDTSTGFNFLDDRWNSASSQMRFRVRTLGTPIQVARLTGAGVLDLGVAGTNAGIATFQGSSSGTVTVQPTAAAGTITATLPTTTGTMTTTAGLTANRVTFGSAAAALQDYSTVIYDPTLVDGGPAFSIAIPQVITVSRTTQTASARGLWVAVTVNPASNIGGLINQSAIQGFITKEGTHNTPFMTGVDCFLTLNATATGTLQAGVATSAWAENAGATNIAIGLIGLNAISRQTHASSVSADLISVNIDPSNGGDGVTKKGTNTNFYGLKITGMGLDTMTCVNRAQIYLKNDMAGTPSGTDYSILSESTRTMQVNGALVIGTTGGAGGIGGFLLLSGVTSGIATIRCPNIAASPTLTTGLVSGTIQAGLTGRVTAQSAANSSIVTLTVGASDTSYNVSANMNVSASTTLVTTLTCTYTDENSQARAMIFPVAQLSGSFIALGAITGTGAWETPVMHIRCKAATAVTILTSTGTFIGVTYTAEGLITPV